MENQDVTEGGNGGGIRIDAKFQNALAQRLITCKEFDKALFAQKPSS